VLRGLRCRAAGRAARAAPAVVWARSSAARRCRSPIRPVRRRASSSASATVGGAAVAPVATVPAGPVPAAEEQPRPEGRQQRAGREHLDLLVGLEVDHCVGRAFPPEGSDGSPVSTSKSWERYATSWSDPPCSWSHPNRDRSRSGPHRHCPFRTGPATSATTYITRPDATYVHPSGTEMGAADCRPLIFGALRIRPLIFAIGRCSRVRAGYPEASRSFALVIM
jgi:hypothetical protein